MFHRAVVEERGPLPNQLRSRDVEHTASRPLCPLVKQVLRGQVTMVGGTPRTVVLSSPARGTDRG